jgi:ribosomal protein S18 acetylase RimI-like enzyme
MHSMSEIVRVQRAQRALAVESLVCAFQDDPMWSYVLPDAETRADAFRPMWDALIGFSRVYGATYTTPAGEGASCWIAPGKTKTTLWKLIRTGFGLPRSILALPRAARDRFFGSMRFIDGHHKELMKRPHWHLWALGVAPEAQGRGIGGALLRPILDRADADIVPCYLETQTEANVAFYRKRGFEVVREERMPDMDLPIWFMIRLLRAT